MKLTIQIFLVAVSSFAVSDSAVTPDNNIQEGDYIHLQVSSGACNNFMSPFLIVTGDQLLTSEVEDKPFRVTYLNGNKIQLQSVANGFWIAANNGGNSKVVVSKTVPVNPGWETFIIEKAGLGQIRIRTADQPNVYYWSANSNVFRNTAVMANSTLPGDCETFNVYRCTKTYDGYCYPSVSGRVWGTVFTDNEVVNSQLLATRDASSDQACAAECHFYPGCTAWVRQTKSSSNNCKLTKRGTSYRSATGTNAGPGANVWNYYSWNTNTAVATYKDAVQSSVTSDNACSNRCAVNSACVAWSREIATNICRLYRSVDAVIASSTSTCGVRTLPVAAKFNNNDNSLQTGAFVNIQSSNGLWWQVDSQDVSGIVRLTANLNPYGSQQQFKIERADSTRLHIQSRASSLWLSFNKVTNSARFSAKFPGDSETWIFKQTTSFGVNKEQVQLQTNDGLHWVTLSESPANDVGICSSNYDACSSVAALASGTPGHLESFNILTPPDQTARLQPDNSLLTGEYYQIQASNGYWWQVEDTTGIIKLMPNSNPNDVNRWFYINNLGSGYLQIQSRKTGLWLRAKYTGGSSARFDAYTPSSWETFLTRKLTNGQNQQIQLTANGGVNWVTLAYSFLNDVETCNKQQSVDRCTSINAMKEGEPSEWEIFNIFSYTAISGTNLGSWFALEQWMNSDVFVDGEWKGVELRTGGAEDEWTWSEQQTAYAGRAGGAIARAVHWDNWITDRDFAWIAAHKINTVRIPVGYWLSLSEEELIAGNYPFFPGGITRLDRAFEVAASYGVWVIISMHGAYGSQNGNDHSGRKGPVDFPNGDNPEKTANFIKLLATRYADRPNFYGIGLINEPYIWDGYIPIPTLHDYLSVAGGYLRTAAPYAMAFMPDAFRLDKINEFLPPFTGSQALECHPYRGFDTYPGSLEEQMNRIQNDIYNMINAGKSMNYWTFVGECSNGANPDVWNDKSESDIYYGRRLYGTMQSAGYAKTSVNLGYTFWTYKVTGYNYAWAEWSLRQSMEDQTWPDQYQRT